MHDAALVALEVQQLDAELGHGQCGQPMLQVSEAVHVLVQGRRPDAEPAGEQAHREAAVPDLIGQPAAPEAVTAFIAAHPDYADLVDPEHPGKRAE